MGHYDHELSAYLDDRLAEAEAGTPEALYDLGLLYSVGQGVERDYVAAHKWFNLAAVRGVKRAQVDRAEIAQDMNQGEIAEAQRQAREWLACH